MSGIRVQPCRLVSQARQTHMVELVIRKTQEVVQNVMMTPKAKPIFTGAQ